MYIALWKYNWTADMGFSHHRRFLTRVGDESHPLHLQLEGKRGTERLVDG